MLVTRSPLTAFIAQTIKVVTFTNENRVEWRILRIKLSLTIMRTKNCLLVKNYYSSNQQYEPSNVTMYAS